MYYVDPAEYTSDTERKQCPQCRGTGLWYGAGAIVNGVFQGKTGPCYACNGSGSQTLKDAYRNRSWVRHNIRRLAGA